MNLGGLLVYMWLLPVIRAEGDPIPDEMYEKIASGSVRSISDIRRLLQIESVDDEENVYDLTRNETRSLLRGSSSHSRVIRSLDAEQAQIAACKTRTEVFEITRQMVDPTNANFLVQPPCVEVQRCSGCCNSRNTKCVPSRVHIRHVLVKKIVVHRSKPTIIHVPIPLEDHLECRCESVNSQPVRSHHTAHEHRAPAGAAATAKPPPPTPRKEEPPLRPSKKKSKKFKHLPNKKEQRELLAT
ncbi:platelet-derived growth factor subunit B [Hyperolius riggenbachi]|uniref:platelet-derived growth factor subunit B n=1 Tax=Hyperolius riggenbachi TaxID=752182 RepID=UPI0035A3BE76